jgi:hypothetical protein
MNPQPPVTSTLMEPSKQAAEKRPSAAFPSSFVIAAYIQCTPLADSPTRQRGNSRSLFVATPLSGFREPCIWAFLSSPQEITSSATR